MKKEGFALIEVLAGAAFLAFMISLFAHSLRNLSELRKRLLDSRLAVQEIDDVQRVTPSAIESNDIEALSSIFGAAPLCSRSAGSSFAIFRCETGGSDEEAIYQWRSN